MSRRRSAPTPPPAPRSRRGFPLGKLFFIGLIGLAAAAWFAPTIVMKTGLRDQLLKPALKDFQGKVAIGAGSAGWLSPVEVTGTSVFDSSGKEVLTVGAVRTEKNLLSLVLDQQDVGMIRIEKPHLRLELRPDGSNLEDLLQPFLKSDKSSAPIGFVVEVVDGTVEATQPGGQGQWRLDQLAAQIAVPKARTAYSGKIKTGISTPGANAGSLAGDFQFKSAAAAAVPGADAPAMPWTGTISVQSNGMPLEIASLAARRAGLDLQLSGIMSADAAVSIADQMQTVKITQLSAQNFLCASPSLLGADQIQLASVSGAGEISRSSTQWQFTNVHVKSDVGEVQASGIGPVVSASSMGNEILHAFRRGNWEVRGDVQMAQLAATMPGLLHLRQGTQISSGTMALGLTSRSDGDGNLWNVDLVASQLVAMHAGSSFAWKKPITVKADVRESASGISVNQFTCDSSFLQLGGKGTLAQGQVAVAGDLSQFVNEVGRFLDLGSLKAAGKFSGQADWKNPNGQDLSITGGASAQNFELTHESIRPWREQDLDVQFTAEGKINGGRVVRVDKGTVAVNAAGDQLDLELSSPVTEVSAKTMWPCRAHVQGSLGQWLARLQMFFSLEPWQLDGESLDIEGDVRASPNRVELADTKGSVKNFVVAGPGLLVREPILQVETTATYDVATGEFTTPVTVVSGSTIAFRAENTRLVYLSNQFAGDGNIQFRSNLERLTSIFQDPKIAATYRLQGEAIGAARLAYGQNATTADITATIKDFAYAAPVAKTAGLSITPLNQQAGWREFWKEPQLELALQGSLDASGQQATIEKLELAGDSLSFGAAGGIRQPFGRCEIDISGQYAYDLDRIAQRLQNLSATPVQLQGTGQRPFSFRGPLFAAAATTPIRSASSKTPAPASSFASLQEMLAETSIGWQKLVVQGFEVGEAEVSTKLQDGFLSISPLNLPVSEGKLAIAPKIDLTQSPYIAKLEPGTIVDRVRISPQMCRSWLKYLAPLVADATAAEGHFSVDVSAAQFPVVDPTGGNVQGTFTVHQAQIGPGPLSQEILTLVQQVRAVLDKQPLGAAQSTAGQWLDMPEQKLQFQLADHRVYHRDMQVLVKDVSVKTSGWVGVNQQIALVAEIPVLDEWVAKDRYLASLKGQTIRLPINGTLTRPQIDRTALQQLTRDTVIKAGSNVLQDELNRGLERGLNRLFQPKTAAPAPGTQPPPM